jgi:hypothetical protein
MTSLLDDDELGVNLCNKYPSHTGDDIYTRILDEALAALLRSRETPTSLEVARYVVAVLNLDPEDLPQVEELAFLASMSAQDPELVANWRAKKGKRQ